MFAWNGVGSRDADDRLKAWAAAAAEVAAAAEAEAEAAEVAAAEAEVAKPLAAAAVAAVKPGYRWNSSGGLRASASCCQTC